MSSVLYALMYYLVLAFGLVSCAWWCWKAPRLALIAGVVVTSVSLGSLPWSLFPVRGVATATQAGILFAAVLLGVLWFGGGVRARRPAAFYMALIIALGGALALWTVVSSAQEYGRDKTLLFFARTVLPLLILMLLGPLGRPEVRVVLTTLVWSAALMALRLLAFVGADVERAGFENLYSIGAGRIAGVGVAILLAALLHLRWRSFAQVAGVSALLLLSVAGVGLTGSRGPIVAAVVAVGFLSLVFIRRPGRWYRVVFRGLLLGFSLVVLSLPVWIDGVVSVNPSVARMLNRFVTLGGNLSDAGRIDRYRAAIDAFLQSDGVGIGTGGFAPFYRGAATEGGVRDYPHNVVLEAAAELGVVGLLLVAGAIAISLVFTYRLASRAPSSWEQVLSVLPVYGLVNAMFSYDIAGNSDVWFLMLLPLLVLTRPGSGRRLPTEESEADRTAALGEEPRLVGAGGA